MHHGGGRGTWVLDTSFMKGQLSSCRTSSTVSCSQADSSWTPWFLPEERRLDEDASAGERMALEGLGGVESVKVQNMWGWFVLNVPSPWTPPLLLPVGDFFWSGDVLALLVGVEFSWLRRALVLPERGGALHVFDFDLGGVVFFPEDLFEGSRQLRFGQNHLGAIRNSYSLGGLS